KRTQGIYLCPAQQCANHLKRWVFGGSAYEHNITFLYCSQQTILLRFTKTMYFVYKQQGLARLACHLYHLPHLLHTGIYRTKTEKWQTGLLSNDLCQSGFANTRSPPNYHGLKVLLCNHMPDNTLRTHQMLLPYIFIQTAGSHSLCQRSCI